jgi:predicted enzyme involved in methoxymalonyl-ACP biosynthesis
MPVLTEYDPLVIPATSSDVKRIRKELEQRPIEVGGYLADGDDVSERRMLQFLLLWDAAGADSVNWVMADNEIITFSKEEFEDFVEDVQVARAKRIARLHQSAQKFKADPNLTQRMLVPENW